MTWLFGGKKQRSSPNQKSIGVNPSQVRATRFPGHFVGDPYSGLEGPIDATLGAAVVPFAANVLGWLELLLVACSIRARRRNYA